MEWADMNLLISYWLNADESHPADMGVDIKKLPTKHEFLTYWKSQLEMPVK